MLGLVVRRRRRAVSPFLVFTTQPGGANSGSALSPQPVVTAKKADGTTDTSFVGNVTVAVNTITGSHSLGGTVTVAAVAGVATFTNVTDTGSGGASLTATATSYQSATSASFTTSAGGGPTTYRQDTFNRADNASLLGTPSDAGAGWTVYANGPFGISSNKAVTGTNAVAALESSHADGVVSVQIWNVTDESGLIFRLADATNFWRLIHSSGRVYLAKLVAGSLSNVSNYAAPLAAGDQLIVTLSGGTLAASYKTAASGYTTETSIFSGVADGGFNTTATKHGIGTVNASGTPTFDNFLVTS